MAKGLQIITDLGSLDLFQNEAENFYVSRQIFDINDLQSRKADYTRDIQIPATALNKVILGSSSALENIKKEDQTITCSVVLDGITITPSARLLHTSTQIDGGVQSYNVVILYGNFNLFDNIKGGGINEMNWADIPINWNTSNLSLISTKTSSHGFFLADWFQVGASQDILTEDIWDIRQAGMFIYSKEIIRRIILEAGFTVKYKDVPLEFHDHALAIPVSQFIIDEEPKGVVDVGDVSTTLDRTATGQTLKAGFNNIISNPNNMWITINNHFIARKSEDFTIVIQGNATFEEAKNNTPPCEVRIVKNGGVIATEFFQGDGTNVPFFLSIEEPLSVNDIIHVDLFAPVDGPQDSILTLLADSRFTMTEAGGLPSDIVQLSNYIPIIERKDYLIGVLAHYGLIIKTNDVLKEVEITQFDLLCNRDEQDWSDNIDVGIGNDVLENLFLSGYGRNNTFKYTPDPKTKRTDMNGLVISNNQILSLNKDILTLPYSASDPSKLFPEDRIKMIRVPLMGQETELFNDDITITGSNFVISVERDFHVGNYLVLPLLGGDEYHYISAKTSDTSGTVLGTPTFSGTVGNFIISKKSFEGVNPRTAIIRTAEHNVIDSSMTKEVRYLSNGTNVNTSQALPENHRVAHFLPSMLFNNILKAEYSTLIASMLNPQFLQAWFNFPAFEFVNIDLFNTVYLRQLNARYFINKIDQFKVNQSVRVDLVRLDESGEDAKNNITIIEQTVASTGTTEKLTINGGADILPEETIDFDRGDVLLYSFSVLDAGLSNFQLIFKNDLSQTTIKSFITNVVTTVHTLELIPKEDPNWEGGNITVTAQVHGA